MSRARNIKPGFFKNDRLAECGPLTRILFAALWCEADREGRLEDRPKRIKAECLPYDDCDVDAMLNELAGRGFIVRYSHGSGRFIQVSAFNKHQNPHMREPASSIPAPVEHSASTVLSTEKAETGPEKGDGKPTESPEPARLFPLSPSLIPEREPASDDAPPTPKREATGTRLPADWQPDDALKAWAVNERKDLNIEREIASFVDYWIGKAGRDGRKSNWPAAFRNWIRNSRNGAPRQSFAAQQGGSRVAGRLL